MHPSKQKLADGSLEAVDEISVVVFYTTSSWQWYKRKRLKKCLFVLKVFKLRTLLDTESITKWSLAPMAQDWSKLAASLPAAFWWLSELPICQHKLIKTHWCFIDELTPHNVLLQARILNKLIFFPSSSNDILLDTTVVLERWCS